MPEFRLSRKAKSDYAWIYKYTAHNWGIPQAHKYRDGLRTTFVRLAERPEIGRKIPVRDKSLFRHNYERHAIFYIRVPNGILVLRILHSAMNPPEHL